MRTLLPILVLLSIHVACASEEANPDPGNGNNNNNKTGASATTPASGRPSTQMVQNCKASCDKMKFFSCSTAAELAECYDDCSHAAGEKIEPFIGCATSSICDAACRDLIKGRGANGCDAACGKAISCSFMKAADKPTCLSICEKDAYQHEIDCVVATACSSILSTCGTPRGFSATTEGGGGGD